MRRTLRLLVLAGVAATAMGCATLMPVGSHVARGVDFVRYRTYDWGPADALPVTDERLAENPYFVDEVHGAIDTQLNRRGLMRADAVRADLLVHYHAAVTGRVEVASAPGPYRACRSADCQPTVTTYDAGTLVIDIVDASTGELVWRGWAEHRLEDMLDDPALVHRRVQDAVRRVFDTFPLPAEATSRRTALEGTR